MTAPYIKDSDTSRAAAKSMEPHLTGMQQRLLKHVRSLGKRGCTCDEAEHILNVKHQTISARFRDLYLAGWLYRTTRRRKTRSGRMAVVYRSRRVMKPNKCCVCDRPTCSRWPCKQLREYRTTHRVISEAISIKEFGIETIRDLLDHIESECEILVK